jgi:hypothetical protein
MPDINPFAVLAATVAAFAISGLYYTIFAKSLAGASGADETMTLRTVAAELGRTLILATVVAGLTRFARIEGLSGGIVLGVVLWIGFPVVLWTGAMLHENTPMKVAAIHAGDWLPKLWAVTAIASVWH